MMRSALPSDVYKRQVIGIVLVEAVGLEILFEGVGLKILIILDAEELDVDKWHSAIGGEDVVSPVSYTHLDAYKRQSPG